MLFLAVLAMIGGARRRATAAPGRWVWPMPRLPDGRPPVISDGYHVRPGPPPVEHNAVDLMYKRPVNVPGKYPLPDNGSKMFEVPRGTVSLAAADGKIWSTGKDAHGNWIVIDHGKEGDGRSTVYRHLEVLAVPDHSGGKRADGGPALRVFAGDAIGTVGYDPSGAAKIRHLHFELRDGKTPINPTDLMSTWEIVS